MATIRVRGHAVVPGDPDDAELVLLLTALRPTPDEAYAEVASRSERVEGLFVERGIDPDARSTAGVSLREHREYDRQSQPQHRGYVAGNGVVVRLGDPALLARLIREAVTTVDASITGPAWRLAPDNPARLEAGRQAAARARHKAEAYAQALGVRLGALVEVAEPATEPRDPHSAFVMEERGTFGPIDQPEIPVAPPRLDARATLDVTFALEQA
jgi:uncharacterized protein YggE